MSPIAAAPGSTADAGLAAFARGVHARRGPARAGLIRLNICAPWERQGAQPTSPSRSPSPMRSPPRGISSALSHCPSTSPFAATGTPATPDAAAGTPAALLGALTWLPLRHTLTTAAALAVAVGIGATAALQEWLLPQFMYPSCRVALCAVLLAQPLLRALDDVCQRRWQRLRERDLEWLMTERLAGEARLAGHPEGQGRYVTAVQKLRGCLDDLAELYRDLGRDAGAVGQAVAYLIGHWHALTWQIFAAQLVAQAIGTGAAALWRLRVQAREAELQDEADTLDRQMPPVHSYGDAEDYRNWAARSAANRDARADLAARAGWIKLLQAGAPALVTTAVLVGAGWLGAAPVAVALYAGVVASLAASRRLAEAVMKAPRRALRLRELRSRMAIRLQRLAPLHDDDLAAHVDLPALTLTAEGQALTPQQLGARLAAGTPGLITVHGANRAGKSSLLALLTMAHAPHAQLVPTDPWLSHDGANACEHASTGTRARARLLRVTDPARARTGLLCVDEWGAHLDAEHRREVGARLRMAARRQIVVDAVPKDAG